MFVLTLTDDKLLKFVLILGEEERKFEFFVLRLFGEKSLAGSEPLLAYYYADFSVSHFLKFATSKNEVANFKIPHPQNQLTFSAKPSAKHAPNSGYQFHCPKQFFCRHRSSRQL